MIEDHVTNREISQELKKAGIEFESEFIWMRINAEKYLKDLLIKNPYEQEKKNIGPDYTEEEHIERVQNAHQFKTDYPWYVLQKKAKEDIIKKYDIYDYYNAYLATELIEWLYDNYPQRFVLTITRARSKFTVTVTMLKCDGTCSSLINLAIGDSVQDAMSKLALWAMKEGIK